MSFKDALARDLDTFINLDEFCDLHYLEGCEVSCSVDADMLAELPGGIDFGVDAHRTTLYVKTSQLEDFDIIRRGYGSPVEFDGKIYTVISWTENKGIAQIVMTVPLED